MRLLYTTAIHAYTFFIRCAAGAGVSKAKKWVAGRRRWRDKLPVNPDNRKTAWFHCASLGEFEQGRPVMEAFKEKHPGYRIVLTFFSPSGYEVRKEYSGVDAVAYLPPDTPRNANRFIRQIQPDIAFFVKYEFWFNYLHALKSHNTPVYLVSGVFRKQQHFFRWYGGWFRKQLEAFDKFFVQNTASRNLVEEIYPGKALITGDTRFDRVYAIARQTEPFPAVEAFKDGRMLFIAGSTWPAGEAVILPSLLKHVKAGNIKLVIAPHEVGEQRIQTLMQKLPEEAVRYSKAGDDFPQRHILVVDSIGILSHLYQYADIAYIGGGFGVGIHNTLEAATFGVPVIFGPNYHKFQEAQDLIDEKAAFPMATSEAFSKIMAALVTDYSKRSDAGKRAHTFVSRNKGGTALILDSIIVR